MKSRCHNPKNAAYENYGGRGIEVCQRWRESFANFLADMGPRPQGATIERRDNDGDYEPGNCVWASRSEQAHNKRTNVHLTYGGVTRPLHEWAKLYGTTGSVLQRRFKKFGTLEPIKARRKKT